MDDYRAALDAAKRKLEDELREAEKENKNEK